MLLLAFVCLMLYGLRCLEARYQVAVFAMIALGVDKHAEYLPHGSVAHSKNDRLVELGFAVLAVVVAFVLFLTVSSLAFSLGLPDQQ